MLSFAFYAAGNGGTLTYTPAVGSAISSPFTTINPNDGERMAPYSQGGHDINFVSDGPGLNPRYTWVKVGCDSATNTTISGHHSTQSYQGFFGWQPFAQGSCSVTR